MFKKALFSLMVLLAVPNLAAAYNYWTVSISTSPVIAGAITPPSGADFVTSGNTTNAVSATVTSADFTVNAAPAGSVLSYVSIDGVAATPVSPGIYRVN